MQTTKYTTQSPFVDQHLCTTLCKLNYIVVSAPTLFGIYRQRLQGLCYASNYCNHLMFREEFSVRQGSLKIVSVDTETRRSSNYYVIKYTYCVHKCWLVSDDTKMMYGTYDIIQPCAHWFPEKRITLTIVRNIDIVGTADRAIKLGNAVYAVRAKLHLIKCRINEIWR